MFAQVLKVISKNSSRKNDPLMLCKDNPEVCGTSSTRGCHSLPIMLIFFLYMRSSLVFEVFSLDLCPLFWKQWFVSSSWRSFSSKVWVGRTRKVKLLLGQAFLTYVSFLELTVKCTVEPGMNRSSHAMCYPIANANCNFKCSLLISSSHALFPCAALTHHMLIHCCFMDLENNLEACSDVKH